MNSEIKQYLDEQSKFLAVNKGTSTVEAERRAGLFLEVCSKIVDWRHNLSEIKIKTTTLQSVVFAEELSKCSGKTITQDKLTVEANPLYTSIREEVEYNENDVTYLKSMYDVFMAAHVFYRNQAKESF